MVGERTTMAVISSSVSPLAAWAKVDEDSPQYRLGLRWYVRYGVVGSLRADTHSVTEHDDGTITVTPSLVMPSRNGVERWHGWLRRGEFTGQFELV